MEQPVHLEAHCPARAFGVLARAAFSRRLLRYSRPTPSAGRCRSISLATAVVDKHLQVHLGLAAQFVDVAQELPLVGADGSAQTVVVVEDGSKPEGQHRGMLEAVGDDPGVVHAGFLVQGFRGVVFADDTARSLAG
jgi:hypothetical protein